MIVQVYKCEERQGQQWKTIVFVSSALSASVKLMQTVEAGEWLTTIPGHE